MNTRAIVDQYDALIDRAKKVVSGAPFWEGCHEELARISINKNTATLHWSEDGDAMRIEFPLELLLMPEAEFRSWKEEKMNEHEAKQKELQQANEQRRTKSELAMLAILKRKYERN